MSDNKVSWHPPMLPPEKLNPKFRFDQLKFEDCINFLRFNPKEPKKTKQYSEKVKELHHKWQNVMVEEAKVQSPKFKIKSDPNISVEFFESLEKIANRLNCDVEDLAGIMYRESRFDPQAESPSGKYTGLIQMDKETFENCIKLKNRCTYEQYCKLPREEQLKYAEEYLRFRINEKGLTGKKLSGGEIYTLIHVPSHIHNSEEIKKHQARVDRAKKVPLKYKKMNIKT